MLLPPGMMLTTQAVSALVSLIAFASDAGRVNFVGAVRVPPSAAPSPSYALWLLDVGKEEAAPGTVERAQQLNAKAKAQLNRAIEEEKASKSRLDLLRDSLEAQGIDVAQRRARVEAEWDRLEELARSAEVLDGRVTSEEAAIRRVAEGLEEKKGELEERKLELDAAERQIQGKHPIWKSNSEGEVKEGRAELAGERKILRQQTSALRMAMESWSAQRTALGREEWALRRLQEAVKEQRTLHDHTMMVLRRRQGQLAVSQKGIISSQDAALDGKADLERSHQELQRQHGQLRGQHHMLKGIHKAMSESHEELQEMYGATRHRHRELQGEHDDLEYDHDELEEEHEDLQKEHKRLQTKRLKLHKKHRELRARNGVLEADFEDLATAHQRLQDDNDALHRAHGSLRGAHHELAGEHEALQARHEALEGNLQSEKAAHEDAVRIIEAMKEVLKIEDESIQNTEEAVDATLRAVEDCAELHLTRKLRDLTWELNKVR